MKNTVMEDWVQHSSKYLYDYGQFWQFCTKSLQILLVQPLEVYTHKLKWNLPISNNKHLQNIILQALKTFRS